MPNYRLYDSDSEANVETFVFKPTKNRVSAINEVLAQEIMRLIIPYNPETRWKSKTSTTGKKTFYVLSEEIPDYRSFKTIGDDWIYEPYLLSGLGQVLIGAIVIEELDLNTGNIGIDIYNRVVKIDGNLALSSTYNCQGYFYSEELRGRNTSITSEDIKRLPNLHSYNPYNWLNFIQGGKPKKNDSSLALRNNKQFKKEVYEAILRFCILPPAFIKIFVKRYFMGATEKTIKDCTNIIQWRISALKNEALKIDEFKTFLHTITKLKGDLFFEILNHIVYFTVENEFLLNDDERNQVTVDITTAIGLLLKSVGITTYYRSMSYGCYSAYTINTDMQKTLNLINEFYRLIIPHQPKLKFTEDNFHVSIDGDSTDSNELSKLVGESKGFGAMLLCSIFLDQNNLPSENFMLTKEGQCIVFPCISDLFLPNYSFNTKLSKEAIVSLPKAYKALRPLNWLWFVVDNKNVRYQNSNQNSYGSINAFTEEVNHTILKIIVLPSMIIDKFVKSFYESIDITNRLVSQQKNLRSLAINIKPFIEYITLTKNLNLTIDAYIKQLMSFKHNEKPLIENNQQKDLINDIIMQLHSIIEDAYLLGITDEACCFKTEEYLGNYIVIHDLELSHRYRCTLEFLIVLNLTPLEKYFSTNVKENGLITAIEKKDIVNAQIKISLLPNSFLQRIIQQCCQNAMYSKNIQSAKQIKEKFHQVKDNWRNVVNAFERMTFLDEVGDFISQIVQFKIEKNEPILDDKERLTLKIELYQSALNMYYASKQLLICELFKDNHTIDIECNCPCYQASTGEELIKAIDNIKHKSIFIHNNLLTLKIFSASMISKCPPIQLDVLVENYVTDIANCFLNIIAGGHRKLIKEIIEINKHLKMIDQHNEYLLHKQSCKASINMELLYAFWNNKHKGAFSFNSPKDNNLEITKNYLSDISDFCILVKKIEDLFKTESFNQTKCDMLESELKQSKIFMGADINKQQELQKQMYQYAVDVYGLHSQEQVNSLHETMLHLKRNVPKYNFNHYKVSSKTELLYAIDKILHTSNTISENKKILETFVGELQSEKVTVLASPGTLHQYALDLCNYFFNLTTEHHDQLLVHIRAMINHMKKIDKHWMCSHKDFFKHIQFETTAILKDWKCQYQHAFSFIKPNTHNIKITSSFIEKFAPIYPIMNNIGELYKISFLDSKNAECDNLIHQFALGLLSDFFNMKMTTQSYAIINLEKITSTLREIKSLIKKLQETPDAGQKRVSDYLSNYFHKLKSALRIDNSKLIPDLQRSKQSISNDIDSFNSNHYLEIKEIIAFLKSQNSCLCFFVGKSTKEIKGERINELLDQVPIQELSKLDYSDDLTILKLIYEIAMPHIPSETELPVPHRNLILDRNEVSEVFNNRSIDFKQVEYKESNDCLSQTCCSFQGWF